MTKHYIGFGFLTAVMIGLIVYGFVVAGTPSQRMAANFDNTRMSNFNSISYQINYYYEDHNQLPAALSDLPNIKYYNKDPQTSAGYDFTKITDTSYKLCATFSEDSEKEKNSSYDDFYMDYGSSSGTKTHKKGYDCITYEIPKSYQTKLSPPSAWNNLYQVNSINHPAANENFYQGSNNFISWNGDFAKSVNIILLDTGGKTIGYISTTKLAATQNTANTYWTALTVFSDQDGKVKVDVKPGKYKIQIINPTYNDISLSSEFTITSK